MSSDIIVARSPMKDHEGLIPVQAEREFCFVVNCPSLHIISGNNIRPRPQTGTDVRLKLSCILPFWHKMTCTNRLRLAFQS
jgi:hypothetical protein